MERRKGRKGKEAKEDKEAEAGEGNGAGGMRRLEPLPYGFKSSMPRSL